jgi:chromosome transmission fidelity protein 18
MHHAQCTFGRRCCLTLFCHVHGLTITGEGRSKKRKRGPKGPVAPSGGLSVPVICTANDAYAPCLRPLRDIAAVYHFKPPAPDKLSARLAAIAAAEGLSLDKQVR